MDSSLTVINLISIDGIYLYKKTTPQLDVNEDTNVHPHEVQRSK